MNSFLRTEFIILFERIELLEKGFKDMNIMLSILSEQITKTQQVQQQAIEAIQKIASEIQSQAEDQEAIKTLADNLKASTDALASSVSAVTPPAPQQ